MVSVRIDGIQKLQEKLEHLTLADMAPAIKQATAAVETQAKLLVPVDSGELRRSIHPKVEQSPEEIVGTVYTTKEYAAYVEFGTGRKGQGTYPHQVEGLTLEYRQTNWAYPDEKAREAGDEDAVIWTSGQVAQPYMYPALEITKPYIKRLIAAQLNKELRKAGK